MANTLGTYADISVASEPFWTVPFHVTDDVIAKTKPTMSKTAFAVSCLNSINADNKVWYVLGPPSSELNIYVKAGSNVKPEIFELDVWDKSPTTQGLINFSLHTITEGRSVFVHFLNNGYNAFDVVASIGKSVRRLDGITVQPSTQSYVSPVTSFVDNYLDGPDDSSLLLDDEIPF